MTRRAPGGESIAKVKWALECLIADAQEDLEEQDLWGDALNIKVTVADIRARGLRIAWDTVKRVMQMVICQDADSGWTYDWPTNTYWYDVRRQEVSPPPPVPELLYTETEWLWIEPRYVHGDMSDTFSGIRWPNSVDALRAQTAHDFLMHGIRNPDLFPMAECDQLARQVLEGANWFESLIEPGVYLHLFRRDRTLWLHPDSAIETTPWVYLDNVQAVPDGLPDLSGILV